MNNALFSHIQILWLVSIFTLCAYSYHPRFFNIAAGQISNHSVVFVIELLILTHVLINVWKSKFTSLSVIFFISLFFIGLISFGLQTLDFNSNFSECTNMLPAFFGLYIGTNLTTTEKNLLLSLRCYVVCSIIIGFACISHYLGAFIIADQYLVAGKNAFGTTLAIAGIISFYLFVYKRNAKPIMLLDISSVVIIFIELLTIRARLATLGFLIVCVILFLRSNLKKNYVFFIIVFLAGAVFLSTNYSTALNFIYNSFFQNKESDFTSARLGLYSRALEIIYQSPFLGNYDGRFFVDKHYQVHNFLLNKLSHYGVLLSIPWFFLYFRLFFCCIKNWLKCSSDSLLLLGCSVMFMLFWESLGEYTYPFGPGTITFLPFLVFGFTVTHNKNESYLIA